MRNLPEEVVTGDKEGRHGSEALGGSRGQPPRQVGVRDGASTGSCTQVKTAQGAKGELRRPGCQCMRGVEHWLPVKSVATTTTRASKWWLPDPDMSSTASNARFRPWPRYASTVAAESSATAPRSRDISTAAPTALSMHKGARWSKTACEQAAKHKPSGAVGLPNAPNHDSARWAATPALGGEPTASWHQLPRFGEIERSVIRRLEVVMAVAGLMGLHRSARHR
jgi:hypothetical protein